MRVELTPEVLRDGTVGLQWTATPTPRSVTLLLMRTGSVPAVHSLQLAGDTQSYRIDGLSRHQRYRVAVLAAGEGEQGVSSWWSVTPRQGVQPLRDAEEDGLQPYISRIQRVTVMPQDSRLTVYWQRSPGFVDKVVIDVRQQGTRWKQVEVDPEVTSLSLDKSRGVPLINGRSYDVRVHTRFSGVMSPPRPPVVVTPAPQGQEREANRERAQVGLVYPSLSLQPEISIFADEEQEGVEVVSGPSVVCCNCQAAVTWNSYRLVCGGCGAEFIPNGRGAFLEIARLRFGTCQCCLPKKILVQRQGAESLACVHSGKEHMRMPGSQGFSLIEDLPFGLCQCCRPRRPLLRRRGGISCSKSGEKHQNEAGAWVLVPSQPVFDAAAIDDLLDAGMAEICSTGVSRGSA